MSNLIFAPSKLYQLEDLPEPYNGMARRTTDPAFIPKNSGAQAAVLNSAVVASILSLKGISIPGLNVFCSILTDGLIVSEVREINSGMTSMVAYTPNSGDMQATKCNNTKSVLPFPTIGPNSKKITLLI